MPAETLVKEGDETANWKVYRNEEFGFEVKYPADPRWVLKAQEFDVPTADMPPNNALKQFLVQIINIPNILNLKAEKITLADYNGVVNITFIHRSFQKEKERAQKYWTPVPVEGVVESDTFFNDKPAIKFSMPRANEYIVYISPDITLSIYISNTEKVYSQILSTFRFIE